MKKTPFFITIITFILLFSIACSPPEANTPIVPSPDPLVVNKKTWTDAERYIKSVSLPRYLPDGRTASIKMTSWYAHTTTEENYLYIYSDNRLLDQIRITDHSNDLLRHFEYKYNADLVSTVDKFNSFGIKTNRKEYSYKPDNTLNYVDSFAIDTSGDTTHSSHMINVYDPDGSLDRQDYYLFDVSGDLYYWKYYQYVYYLDKNIALIIDFQHNDGTDDTILTYLYYEYGYLSQTLAD